MRSTAAPSRQRRANRRGLGLIGLAATLVWAGGMVLLTPTATTWFNQVQQLEALEQQLELEQKVAATPGAVDKTPADEVLQQARAFNERLASGLVDTTSSNYLEEYREQLLLPGSTVMARVRIDSIGIDQPLRHTFEEWSLRAGLGHAERSSLPVGGPNTRAVIGGHRGLATAVGLTDLPDVELGDVVRIDVLGQRMQYRVIHTEMVSPETADLQPIQAGRDLITLITCAPLNVNSHRFIVTAERIDDAPTGAVGAAGSAGITTSFASSQPSTPWWAYGAGAITLAVATATITTARHLETQQA